MFMLTLNLKILNKDQMNTFIVSKIKDINSSVFQLEKEVQKSLNFTFSFESLNKGNSHKK